MLNPVTRFEDFGEKFPVIGLGVFILIAGASKFIIPEYWTGYEPRILLETVPLAAEQFILLGGAFESFLGLMLITRKKASAASLITAFWLSAILIQLIRLQLWDLAIRDLGLTFYAFSVYILQKTRQ
jgi:hypothetical protein